MKKLNIWIVATVFLMIGCPWLSVEFAGPSGMAACFILFYVVNPLFSLFSGVFAGIDIKKLWSLPLVVSLFFLVGTWIFFEFNEPAFWLYSACYLVISSVSMIVSFLIKKIHNNKTPKL